MATLSGCGARGESIPGETRLRIGVGVAAGPGRESSLKTLTERMIAESLISVDPTGRPTPNLANVFWEDEGRTLRVSLRPDVTFHDGRPLTAAVAASILNKALAASRNNRRYFGGLEYVERIDTSDDVTVLLHLSRPDSFLVSQLSSITIVDAENPDIGTGPFKLVARDPNMISVEKYAGYYRGQPGLDRVEILPYETHRSAWVAMMRGKVDMLQEADRESVEFLAGSSDVRTYSSLRSYYVPLVFNVRHPVLGRVEVRRALNEAIDRQQILKNGLRGHGQVADDPVWPLHWAYNKGARRFTHNPDAARARLEAENLPVQQDGSTNRMSSRFRFTCLFWSEDPQYERIALLLQRQLSEVGVDMDLQPLTQGDLAERARNGNFDAYLFQTLGGRSFDLTYRFWHSRTGSLAAMQDNGYSAADTILEHIRAAKSDPEMRIAVADLQQRFFDDPPAVFLVRPELTRAVNARIEVGDANDLGIFANVWRWKLSQVTRAAR